MLLKHIYGKKYKCIINLLLIAILLFQVGCANPEKYEASLGIIHDWSELSSCDNYQLAWINKTTIDELEESDTEHLIQGNSRVFIPTMDVSWLKEFANKYQLTSYIRFDTDNLLGVILDPDADDPKLIPVYCIRINTKGMSENRKSLGYNLAFKDDERSKESILLKLYSSLYVSNRTYADRMNYFTNCCGYTDEERYITLKDEYALLISSFDDELLTADSVISAVHFEIIFKNNDDKTMAEVVECIEIIPFQNISIDSFDIALIYDESKYSLSGNERYDIGKYVKDDFKGVFFTTDDENTVPVSYTWADNNYKYSMDQGEIVWSGIASYLKKNLTYCLAVGYTFYSEDSDNNEGIKGAFDMVLRDVSLRGSHGKQWSFNNTNSD